VNDDVITLYELNNKMKEMTGASPEEMRLKDEQRFLEVRQQVLEFLIDQKITQRKVQEMGIKITDKEVDDSVERVKRNNQWTQEDLVARLKKEGISYEKYREDIRGDLERYQLINYAVNSKIIIREEELKKYYEDHKDDFATEGKVRIATIILMADKPGDKSALEKVRKEGEEILAKIKTYYPKLALLIHLIRFHSIETTQLNIDIDEGSLELRDAIIPHFSRFGFAR